MILQVASQLQQHAGALWCLMVPDKGWVESQLRGDGMIMVVVVGKYLKQAIKKG